MCYFLLAVWFYGFAVSPPPSGKVIDIVWKKLSKVVSCVVCIRAVEGLAPLLYLIFSCFGGSCDNASSV